MKKLVVVMKRSMLLFSRPWPDLKRGGGAHDVVNASIRRFGADTGHGSQLGWQLQPQSFLVNKLPVELLRSLP